MSVRKSVNADEPIYVINRVTSVGATSKSDSGVMSVNKQNNSIQN